MSILTTALSDSLPSSVPKLDASGLNWAILSICFCNAVKAKGFWGHFDGTTPFPTIPPMVRAHNSTITSALTTGEIAAEAQ